MNLKLKIEYKDIKELREYKNNAKIHPQNQIELIKKSIAEFGMCNPILVHNGKEIIAGHGRLEALKQLGYKKAPTIDLSHLTEEQKKAYIIADNRTAEFGYWDEELLQVELNELKDFQFENFDINDFDFDFDFGDNIEESEQDISKNNIDIEEKKIDIDEVVIKEGDIIEIGKHKIICGDSTKEATYKQLLSNRLVNLIIADAPYGLNKNFDNDNLKNDDLLEFNKNWIPLSLKFLDDKGSWYCWNYEEPIMDIYAFVLRPLIKDKKINFRNLIVWDKGNVRGQKSSIMRSYPKASEFCLFITKGYHGFDNNAYNFYNGFAPIVDYLEEQKKKSKLTLKQLKVIANNNPDSGVHWFGKSQWQMPPKEAYEAWQRYCKENNLDCFIKDYNILLSEYKEALENKKEDTYNYFDITFDNINNIWHIIPKYNRDEYEQQHDTPKPLKIYENMIKASTKEGEMVLDCFLGSGTCLLVSEMLNRVCYGIEISPKNVQLSLERLINLINDDNIRLNGKQINFYEYKKQKTIKKD